MTNGKNIDVADAARRKSANLRLAVILVSVAVVFFVGIIATRFMGGPTTGIGVMGAAVLLFLVIAIGRHLRPGASAASDGGSPGDRGARRPTR